MKHKTGEDAERSLLIARAQAIQEYATIEQSLCVLCARLLDTPNDRAGIVFFKITAARARNRAIEELVRARFGATYNFYWNALIKLLNQTDQRRNEIVHWQTAHEIGYDGIDHQHECQLTPPNIWAMKPTTPFISVKAMQEFGAQCDFISRSINMFTVIAVETHIVDPIVRQTWLGIFQQALAYPPPDTHPLSPNYKKP